MWRAQGRLTCRLPLAAYLINNGAAYPTAHAVGLIEHILETAYLPAKYRLFKSQGGLVIIGAGIVLAGQVLRSFAMISAASNFSHM
jgi:protein-S-isoprenylcysteine O-methyltransferase